jgi:hypothetical protein
MVPEVRTSEGPDCPLRAFAHWCLLFRQSQMYQGLSGQVDSGQSKGPHVAVGAPDHRAKPRDLAAGKTTRPYRTGSHGETETPRRSRARLRQLMKGDRVVVRTKRGEVIAKMLQRQTPKSLELASFKADQEISLPSDRGRGVDRPHHLGEPVKIAERSNGLIRAIVLYSALAARPLKSP